MVFSLQRLVEWLWVIFSSLQRFGRSELIHVVFGMLLGKPLCLTGFCGATAALGILQPVCSRQPLVVRLAQPPVH